MQTDGIHFSKAVSQFHQPEILTAKEQIPAPASDQIKNLHAHIIKELMPDAQQTRESAIMFGGLVIGSLIIIDKIAEKIKTLNVTTVKEAEQIVLDEVKILEERGTSSSDSSANAIFTKFVNLIKKEATTLAHIGLVPGEPAINQTNLI